MRHRAQRIMTRSRLFRRHENLSEEVNCNLVQSEIEDDVRLQDLEPGSVLWLISVRWVEAASRTS
jgi:hypothetical protein